MDVIRDIGAMAAYPHPVVALGNFDGVHLGHQAILHETIGRARAGRGAALALTFDPLPAKLLFPERAPNTLLTVEDKIDLLRACGIDAVIVLNFTLELSRRGPREFVREYLVDAIRAHSVVIGQSVSFGHRRMGNAAAMAALGREYGFETTVVGPVKVDGLEVSSTKIRELISRGDLRGAAGMLGRYHFLAGTVVRGHERGRQIGFPTANLESATECIPADGVYATRVGLPDGLYPSITNIGMRPTFAETARSIETHIFDFNRDLYGARIKLELVERIRGERKFESGAELARQIAQDLSQAKEILAAA